MRGYLFILDTNHHLIYSIPTMKYIAFFEDATHNKAGEYKVYVDDGKGWYLRDGTTLGFDYATVNLYGKDSLRFLRADTLDGIEKEIVRANHIRKYGNGEHGDCACPNCGYKYYFKHYNDDGLDETFSTVVKCICGVKFQANIKVEITFNTKILA